MNKIAISQRVDFFADRDEARDALDTRLSYLIEECGFIPVPIPNSIKRIDSWLESIRPIGFVISGGNNIGEYCNRDNIERALIRYASQNYLPILGICRGMQILAVEDGASIVKVNGHVRAKHRIYGEINDFVNSYHEYSIINCPNNFRITSRCTRDNSIESIKHLFLPWEGWMWHPEREEPFQSNDIIRIVNLFS